MERDVGTMMERLTMERLNGNNFVPNQLQPAVPPGFPLAFPNQLQPAVPFPNQLRIGDHQGLWLQYPGTYDQGQFPHPAVPAAGAVPAFGGSQTARPGGSHPQAPQSYAHCTLPPEVGGGGHVQYTRRFGHAHPSSVDVDDNNEKSDANSSTTAGYDEYAKFQYRNPSYTHHLGQMFNGDVYVDGSNSIAPWNHSAAAVEEAGPSVGKHVLAATNSSSSRKRGGSNTTPSGVSKKSRGSGSGNTGATISPLDMGKMVSMYHYDEVMDTKALSNIINKRDADKKEKKRVVDKCLSLVLECGFAQESDEYMVAIEHFKKDYHRGMFLDLGWDARIKWLRRKAIEWETQNKK